MCDETTRNLAKRYYYRALSYVQADKYKEAIADIEKVEELGCASADEYEQLAYWCRTIADNTEDPQEKQTLYLKAAENFTKSIEISESSS